MVARYLQLLSSTVRWIPSRQSRAWPSCTPQLGICEHCAPQLRTTYWAPPRRVLYAHEPRRPKSPPRAPRPSEPLGPSVRGTHRSVPASDAPRRTSFGTASWHPRYPKIRGCIKAPASSRGPCPSHSAPVQPASLCLPVCEKHPPHLRVASAEDLTSPLSRHLTHQWNGGDLELLDRVLAATS